ncbi:hypothetical protein ABW636_14205 [Aquimarina sp. 2201CG1-2-11]|uniref:hypothetical protein n=1 Tax=Aquimarina discodermiae TaxID=3231043 RepID=UPI0034622EE6
MKLSEENKHAILLEIHQIINDSIVFTIQKFDNKEKNSLDYFVLTDEEEQYISSLKNSKLLQNIIKKVLTRNLDDSFLRFLSIIDGTSEPKEEFGKKSDFILVDMPDDFDESYDFLHDEFFESYDLWEKINSLSKK